MHGNLEVMVGPYAHAPRITEGSPPELVVYDREQPCPYLPDRVSRLPLRLPSRPLTGAELDQRLEQGDRRQGFVLYRPRCPSCRACEPIRLPVADYSFTRRERRILSRGNRALTVRIGPPQVDERRVEIYNRHKLGRNLRDGQPPIDAEGYRDFLVATCCDSFELSFYLGELLIGISVLDRAADSLSAVYTCYDPAYSTYSLGTYSILKQLQLCQAEGLTHLYLGLYIAECTKMTYKAEFKPHERMQNGQWVYEPRPVGTPTDE
jgi:leucyl-tRNA---protein transferase